MVSKIEMTHNLIVSAVMAVATLVFFGASPVRADEVLGAYIRSPAEEGGGYLVQKGPECYLVAPAHVVAEVLRDESGNPAGYELYREMTIRDDKGLAAEGFDEVTISREEDLGLLKLRVSKEFNCRSDWSEGGQTEAILRSAMRSTKAEFRILTVKGNGSMNMTDAALAGRTEQNLFSLGVGVQKGQSGSLVFHGGTFVGMVVNSSRGSGGGKTEVLRQDRIAGLIGKHVTIDGLTLMIGRMAQQNGARLIDLPLAKYSAREYLQPVSGVSVIDAMPADYDKTGALINARGADYVVSMVIIHAGTERLAPLVRKPNKYQTILGLNKPRLRVMYKMQFELKNPRTGQSTVQLIDFDQTYMYDRDQKVVINEAQEIAVKQGLHLLLQKAGIVALPTKGKKK